MRWWGWTVLGVFVLVLVAVGLFVWPGWMRGDASKVAEGGKPPKVETATPAPAPAASDKKDEKVEVDVKGQCEALRAACMESTSGNHARCEILQAECEERLASCPECKAGEPDEVAKCLEACKQKCETAKAKPKGKKPKATAGGSPPSSAPSPAPAPRPKTKGTVVWWTTDLNGETHQWK